MIAIWPDRLDAVEAQEKYKAELCRETIAKYSEFLEKNGCKLGQSRYLPKGLDIYSTPIGFTTEQYQAAYKTLELALHLFVSGEALTEEQRQICKDKITLSRISMTCMWDDLCKSGVKIDRNQYDKITQLANEKIQELAKV